MWNTGNRGLIFFAAATVVAILATAGCDDGNGEGDETPPVITSGPTVTDKSDTTATIEWTTDELSDSVVEYGLDTSYGQTKSDPIAVTSHSITLTGLTSATTYHYRVGSTDTSGNGPTWSSDHTFTTESGTQAPDLIVTEIDAYHYDQNSPPWFNISNEVVVGISNSGAGTAATFHLALFADDELISKEAVDSLAPDQSTTIEFKWTPEGDDCFENGNYVDTSREYNLKAVVDYDNEVIEADETNNEMSVAEEVCYNGYIADEPLATVAHGKLRGGLLFTTGDGAYGGLYSVGDTRETSYQIELPPGASVEIARLNVYYTWHYEKESTPQMEVRIDGTIIPLEVSYNDLKCQCPDAMWVYPWGNYVYDITPYISGSGTYTVSVKRTGGPKFCISAPGIVIVYQEDNKPLIEYWINEGADILIGGRREDGGYLSLEECINTASFAGNIETGTVASATLAVVAPWADSDPDDVVYFNGVEIGKGVYEGYDSPVTKIVHSAKMTIGSDNAQVGVGLTDVTDHLQASDNTAAQGDEGDCIMASNAFLIVEHTDAKSPYTTGHSPAKDATEVPVCTDIVVRIKDDGAGVDRSSVVMTVNGSPVSLSVFGILTDCTTLYCPAADFGYGEVVNVTIDAQDLAGNAMTQESYSFTTVVSDITYSFDGVPVETRVCGRIQGGIYIDSIGWTGSTTLTGHFDVPNGTVKWARLYTGIWCGNPDNTGNIKVELNGSTLDELYLEGVNDTNPNVWSSGFGNTWMFFKVPDEIIPGLTNTVTISKVDGSIDGRVYGIMLVVLYEGGSSPKEFEYWINDGSDGLNYTTPHDEGTTSFNGAVDTISVTSATLTVVHLTGYDPPCANGMKFNNNELDTSIVVTNAFELNSWNVKEYLIPSANQLWFTRCDDPFVNVTNAILVLDGG